MVPVALHFLELLAIPLIGGALYFGFVLLVGGFFKAGRGGE